MSDVIQQALVLYPELFFVKALNASAGMVEPTYKLMDVPVIVRVLRQLQDSGVTKSVLMVPKKYGELVELIKNDQRINHEVRVVTLDSNSINEALKEAMADMNGSSFLVRSDFIAPAALLKNLASKPIEKGMRVSTNSLQGIKEERRLEEENGKWSITDVQVPHVPMLGAILMSGEMVDELKTNGDLLSATEKANNNGEVEIFSCEAYWNHIVRTESDIKPAELKLLNSLRKDIDGLVARSINRNISLPISHKLINTFVTPNLASLSTLIFALLAVWMVSKGGYMWMLLGAAMIQFASIIDGVDGELARLRYHSSKFGEWLDTVIDDFSNITFIAGITYAVWQGAAGPEWLLPFGIISVGCYLFITPMMYAYVIKYTGGGDVYAIDYDFNKEDSKQSENLYVRIMSGLKYVAKRDFYIFSMLLFAIFGALPYFLIPSSLAAFIIVIVVFNQHRQKRAELKAKKQN